MTTTETKITHTPGPWIADDTPSTPIKIMTAGRDWIVGYATYGPASDPERDEGIPIARANAQLIASAPQLATENARLRECLEQLVSAARNYDSDGTASADRLYHRLAEARKLLAEGAKP